MYMYNVYMDQRNVKGRKNHTSEGVVEVLVSKHWKRKTPSRVGEGGALWFVQTIIWAVGTHRIWFFSQPLLFCARLF